MKIRQRIVSGFILVVLLVAAVGVTCLYQLHRIAEPLRKDIPGKMREISESSRLDGLAQFIRYYDEVLTQSARNYAFTQDKKWEQRYRDAEPELDRTIKEAVERGDTKDKEFFSSVDQANLALVQMEYDAIEFVNKGKAEKAAEILKSQEYWDQKKIYEQALRDYVHRKGIQYDEALSASTEEVESAHNKTQILIGTSALIVLVLVVLAVIISIVVGCLIFYSISSPLAKLKAATVEIGAGKLGTQIEIDSDDEVGQLAASFIKMTEDLRKSTTSIERLNKEITERKQAEQELKTERNTLKVLTDGLAATGIGIDIVSFDYRIISQNQLLENRFGDSRGKLCYEVYLGQAKPCDSCPMRKCFKSHQMERMELLGSDGKYYEILSTPLINQNGTVEKTIEVILDITERKQAEEALKFAKQEAEEANHAKSQFLANMSHEIRTPMNAIVGFSDMLADEDLTQNQKADVNTIRGSAKSLLHLINDILDFSKIEAGQLDVEMTNCSLGKLLNSIESMMMPLAKEKSLDFKIVTNKEVPAQIHSDPYRLQQCLVNLTNNAHKFTEQGHVHLQVSLREDKRQHFIRFDVEDTGIGIPDDKQQAIFESFTQVDGSTTRKYGGTGLGLTVTRQLAELLGGELTLTSEEGKGSVFSLVIPIGVDIVGQPLLDRDKARNQVTDESRKADTAMFSGKVLVAEDIEGSQILMKLMLTKLGVDVTIAEDGNQALQKALSQSFDLILMDMQMPHMNGYEATRALKQQGYKTPIVALTANAMKGDDQKCVDAGCDDYLTKPIDRRELPRILAKYLPGRQTSKTIDSVPAQAHESPQISSEALSSKSNNADDIGTIIDWDQLIERLGDEDTVREIMPVYIKDTQELLAKLSQALEMADCAAIAAHAHALKGIGKNLSVGRLADVAHQMEQASRDNDIEASTLYFSGLKIEVEKVLSVLSQCDWIEKAKMV
jgi:signal transduction histidine kinase/CheY-like chemotaxis protein/CHASE3 domain sensor protein